MTSMEERLRLLEDERAILETLYAYGHGLDYGLEDDFMVCWTEDAVLLWPDRASAESMFARLDDYACGPAVRSFGRYRDSLVRCADGHWRFTERFAEREATRAENRAALSQL